MSNSSVSLMTAVVTAIVVFFFTAAWVASKSARSNLRTAKAAVAPARKAVWSTVGGVIKLGALVVFLLIVLVAWQASNTDEEGAGRSPASGPSPSAGRG
ncbi:hypothetical protein [Actinoplanes solisilvae]|uniref:hypothetical protein n=1 Tax=Actinoplanes solisilvae TaxID=2486853 RepID=UPI000FDAA4F7|nr:hypothetical protein [Actinoplanes solisilvae]